MIQLHQVTEALQFPAPQHAMYEPNGLLAFGGDLSPERLQLAYYHGIFPWFSEDEPILWWSPDPRGVLLFENYSPSRSLLKLIRKQKYTITVNRSFAEVVKACASVPRGGDGVWITKDMQSAYIALHQQGRAHSVEVWHGDSLVGGLYGVATGAVFSGESMFHRQSNTSKIAFYGLITHLKQHGFAFIDTQLQNPHLESMGVVEIPRKRFLHLLSENRDCDIAPDVWSPQQIAL